MKMKKQIIEDVVLMTYIQKMMIDDEDADLHADCDEIDVSDVDHDGDHESES